METTIPETASRVRLDVDGMTCASCVAAVERSLNRLDGVEASVNLATEQATVDISGPLEVERLIGAVESIGYGARLAKGPAGHRHEDAALSWRLILAVALTSSRGRARDGARGAIRRLGVGGARALGARRFRRGEPAAPHRVRGRAARQRQHGHARLDRLALGLDVVDGRARRRAPYGHLFRSRGRRHDPCPPRPGTRGGGPSPFVPGDPASRRAECQGGSGAARRPRGARADCRARYRGALRRRARREGRDRRRGGRRLNLDRRLDADRRAGLGGGRDR